MHPRIRRSLLVAFSTAAALLSAAGSSYGASGVDIAGGTFTATSVGLQTLTTRIGGSIYEIGCRHTIDFTLADALFTGAGLRAIGQVISSHFACNPLAGGITPTIFELFEPWTMGATVASFAGTALATVLGVAIQAGIGFTTCLFTGTIGLQMNNGSLAMTLLGATLTKTAGVCSNATASSVTYLLSSAPRWTLLP